MKPIYRNGDVVAVCPICGVQTTFECKHQGNAEYGSIVVDYPKKVGWDDSIPNGRIVFRLLRCAGCGRAGIAAISDPTGRVIDGHLIEFLPTSISKLNLPKNVQTEIEKEFREAEGDASIGNYRSASAMLRSTLEKVLKAHGYTSGDLKTKIEHAADDGIITQPLKRRAHENIRVLGNNILHDDWREVDYQEYEDSHEYTKNVLVCFYDDPATVREILIEKGRISESESEPTAVEEKTE